MTPQLRSVLVLLLRVNDADTAQELADKTTMFLSRHREANRMKRELEEKRALAVTFLATIAELLSEIRAAVCGHELSPLPFCFSLAVVLATEPIACRFKVERSPLISRLASPTHLPALERSSWSLEPRS